MITRTRTAMKFFTYGLLIGIFFAPRSGKETRGRILSWASDNAKSFLGG
jgi:hypothetical protein